MNKIVNKFLLTEDRFMPEMHLRLVVDHSLKWMGLASIFSKFFDKKTSGGAIKNENMSKKELAEETHKPIIRNFRKQRAHHLL